MKNVLKSSQLFYKFVDFKVTWLFILEHYKNYVLNQTQTNFTYMYLGFSCDKALCYTLEINKFCRLYRQKKLQV